MHTHPLSLPDAPVITVPARQNWWIDARFAMSIHYGLYSYAGEGEWVRANRKWSVAEYAHCFEEFFPVADACDRWARAAKLAGAKTLLLTTKHHDGFCLWDTALTGYKSTNTPCRRDLVREFVTACRAHGLRVGLYYSLVDWHHPDYPAAGDRQHPLRHHPESGRRDRSCDWSRYIQYFHSQIEELLTQYGTIDLLVFDFPYWDYRGKKWGAEELIRKVRQLQPDILTNDRLDVEAIKQSPRPAWAGDIDHSEMNIPRFPVTDAAGNRVAFEAWFPLTNAWSTTVGDGPCKTPAQLVRALVNCVSKGGNLCLNPSTLANGELPPEANATLAQLGAWLGANGESIYGCGDAGLEKPEWGRFTRRGSRLYAHILDQPIGHLCLAGLRGRVQQPALLATGEAAVLCDYWNPGIQTFDGPDDIFVNLRQPVAHTHELPDRLDTVIRLEITDEPTRARLIDSYRTAYEQAVAHVPLP
jgi:alpha-L-fucosidase